VNTPFTIEQFLGIFVAYNASIWPAQIVAYDLELVAVAALWLKTPIASRMILAILALMWAWSGIVHHLFSFHRSTWLQKYSRLSSYCKPCCLQRAPLRREAGHSDSVRISDPSQASPSSFMRY
jgi:hypothetical protein